MGLRRAGSEWRSAGHRRSGQLRIHRESGGELPIIAPAGLERREHRRNLGNHSECDAHRGNPHHERYCGQINESRAADATDGEPAPEHSTAARANYYQTRGGGTEIASDRAEVPHRRGAGGFIADAFKKWSRWGRKAVGKSRAENF